MKTTFKLLSIFLIINFHGCIEDVVSPPPSFKLESAAELLTYLEEQGDYINSDEAPSLIDAQDVYNNLTNYLLIDVRDEVEFTAGHIENAINIKPENLIVLLDSIGQSSYQKIILISSSGQSAAYYTSILRISGYDNVYSLNFGMSSWNNDFAKEWLDRIWTVNDFTGFTDAPFPKHPFTNLPNLTFTDSTATSEEKLKERTIIILNGGFEEKFSDTTSLTSVNYYAKHTLNNGDIYLICYGIPQLYTSRSYGIFHPLNSVYYNSLPGMKDFRSSQYLQTLPTNKPILIYSYNGQLSAYITAYLRILGYDARSLLFGASNFIYNIIAGNQDIAEHLFSNNSIMNYPYVVGK